MIYDWLAFIAIALIAIGVSRGYATRVTAPFAATVIVAAVVMRVFGSLARYETIARIYNGLGDPIFYFNNGLETARALWAGTVSPLTASFWTPATERWGTGFTMQVSGVALAFIGPTVRGEFLVFALIGLLGSALLVLPLRQFHSVHDTARVAFFALLWPSVWYWPSAIGKEAIIMLTIGMVGFAYCGRDGKVNWPLLIAGLGLAFMVRPHVATVLAASVVCALWLGAGQGLTLRRVLEGAIGVVVVVVVFVRMQANFGLMEGDVEGLVEMVEYYQRQTNTGASRIGAMALSPLALPFVFLNIWMRPFPWEVHNATAALSALELVAFWYLVWQARSGLRPVLRNWRRHRMLRFVVPLLILYTVMIGATFGNLGLIARQRAPIFPLMLIVLVGFPRLAMDHTERARREAAEAAVSQGEAVPA